MLSAGNLEIQFLGLYYIWNLENCLTILKLGGISPLLYKLLQIESFYFPGLYE